MPNLSAPSARDVKTTQNAGVFGLPVGSESVALPRWMPNVNGVGSGLTTVPPGSSLPGDSGLDVRSRRSSRFGSRVERARGYRAPEPVRTHLRQRSPASPRRGGTCDDVSSPGVTGNAGPVGWSYLRPVLFREDEEAASAISRCSFASVFQLRLDIVPSRRKTRRRGRPSTCLKAGSWCWRGGGQAVLARTGKGEGLRQTPRRRQSSE